MLSIKTVLGLADPDRGDWGRLRADQLGSVSRMSIARIAAIMLAAGLLIQLYWGHVNAVALGGWAVALCLVQGSSYRFDASHTQADTRQATRDDLRNSALIAALNAVIWIVPLALFAPFGGDMRHVALWSIIALLMAGSALVMSSLPASAIAFIIITGSASAVSFAIAGHWLMVGICLLFTIMLVVATIENGRMFLSSQLALAGYAEKSEVVSLLLREFEENEADWLWQIDSARRIRSASPRFAFALGCEPEELEGKSFIEMIAGASWETGLFPSSLHDLAEKLKRRESFSNLMVRVTIKGEERWWELSASPRMSDNGTFEGFRGVGSDVTQQRESSEKIAFLARYDTLTGLPNRLMLTETLKEAMVAAEQWRSRCAFLMIDLDRFKAVNDTLGHLVGDQLLAMVSQRLKSLMSANELCGRLGGDEFAIVIRDASQLDRVHVFAERVIDALSQPYEIDHHSLFIGASIGSAIGPRDGRTVETLMRNADLALYRSKDEGGGQHFSYEAKLHAHAEERRQLESALRNALDRNEMSLNYQPVVDAHSEQIVSFEALLRWNSKEHGFVSPAKFIPLSEDTRLIIPIGEWVLREACLEAANWPSNVKIAVNVSGEQLLDPGFSATVVSALSASGLNARRLEIEVTESIFLRDGTTAQATLDQIMALGCSVALDDFGTGYSSLGYLRKTRFSTIKVDRSFVQGAANDTPESLAIIRAVVAMADSLGMATTAEGVETHDEAELIRRLGCTKIQGYYFGRPMAAADARQLFTAQQARAGMG